MGSYAVKVSVASPVCQSVSSSPGDVSTALYRRPRWRSSSSHRSASFRHSSLDAMRRRTAAMSSVGRARKAAVTSMDSGFRSARMNRSPGVPGTVLVVMS